MDTWSRLTERFALLGDRRERGGRRRNLVGRDVQPTAYRSFAQNPYTGAVLIISRVKPTDGAGGGGGP